jgi:uroporphyrinogen-III synthase
VDEVTAYRTVSGPGVRELVGRLRARALDAITFTSSSGVRHLLDGLADAGLSRPEARALLGDVVVVCIGPVTAATAREEGLRVDTVAREYTAEGLVAALLDWFARPAARR